MACRPVRERPVAHPFARMEESQGGPLTGPEVSLRVLRDAAHLLIDLIEEGGDRIEDDHGLLRVRQGCTLTTSGEERLVHDNKASKHHNTS